MIPTLSQILDLSFLDTFFYIIIILIVAYISLHILSSIITKFWKKFNMDLTILYLITDLLKYIILIFALAWILKLIGIDLQGIIISLGLIGIVVGFAAKDVFSNFIGGIFLITDKNIKVGEIISVDDLKGKVSKVTFRNTEIITVDGFRVTIPNSTLNTEMYVNYPKLELNKIVLEVLVPFGIDLKAFSDDFVEKFEEKSWVMSGKKPIVYDMDISEFGSQVKLFIWVNDYTKISEYTLELGDEVRQIIEKHNKNKVLKIEKKV
ncbi:MAG: mechanosensitive ion channel [Methanobacteriaceae archaeon]|nr:mechanosensitive ion channel [Methanobacteriaceae archaeon]